MADASLLDRAGDAVLGAFVAGGFMLAAKLLRPRRATGEERSDVAGQATALSETLLKRIDQLQGRLDHVEKANEDCEAHRKACEEAVEELTRRVRRLESERPPAVFPPGSEIAL